MKSRKREPPVLPVATRAPTVLSDLELLLDAYPGNENPPLYDAIRAAEQILAGNSKSKLDDLLANPQVNGFLKAIYEYQQKAEVTLREFAWAMISKAMSATNSTDAYRYVQFNYSTPNGGKIVLKKFFPQADVKAELYAKGLISEEELGRKDSFVPLSDPRVIKCLEEWAANQPVTYKNTIYSRHDEEVRPDKKGIPRVYCGNAIATPTPASNVIIMWPCLSKEDQDIKEGNIISGLEANLGIKGNGGLRKELSLLLGVKLSEDGPKSQRGIYNTIYEALEETRAYTVNIPDLVASSLRTMTAGEISQLHYLSFLKNTKSAQRRDFLEYFEKLISWENQSTYVPSPAAIVLSRVKHTARLGEKVLQNLTIDIRNALLDHVTLYRQHVRNNGGTIDPAKPRHLEDTLGIRIITFSPLHSRLNEGKERNDYKEIFEIIFKMLGVDQTIRGDWEHTVGLYGNGDLNFVTSLDFAYDSNGNLKRETVMRNGKPVKDKQHHELTEQAYDPPLDTLIKRENKDYRGLALTGYIPVYDDGHPRPFQNLVEAISAGMHRLGIEVNIKRSEDDRSSEDTPSTNHQEYERRGTVAINGLLNYTEHHQHPYVPLVNTVRSLFSQELKQLYYQKYQPPTTR